MVFTYQAANGRTYSLHGKTVELPNGRRQPIYYFASEVKDDETLDAQPEGYRISESERTGRPALRKV